MQIYNILKRYLYLIITRKNQIVSLFKLLAKDGRIEWSSGRDIKSHNKDFKEHFSFYPTDSFICIRLDYLGSIDKIRLSYETYMYNDPELVFDENTYILAKDLLKASKKTVIILNKK